MKVATILGTRPEIIRLSRVIAALDRYTDHVLIHTGQNYDYELNQVFFEDLEIRQPDYFLQAGGKECRRDDWTGDCEIRAMLLAEVQAGCRADPGRYQQLPGRTRGKTTENSDLPHGSRKPVLRRAGSRGDQPEDCRSYQRYQSAIQRHLPRISAARGDRARSDHQDRQPHVRSTHVLSSENRSLRRPDAPWFDGRWLFRGECASGREHRFSETVSEPGESPGSRRLKISTARDCLRTSADAEAN